MAEFFPTVETVSELPEDASSKLMNRSESVKRTRNGYAFIIVPCTLGTRTF